MVGIDSYNLQTGTLRSREVRTIVQGPQAAPVSQRQRRGSLGKCLAPKIGSPTGAWLLMVSHPADNLCQQENNDTFPQVTVRLTKAQEGLSHPDGEVAREE